MLRLWIGISIHAEELVTCFVEKTSTLDETGGIRLKGKHVFNHVTPSILVSDKHCPVFTSIRPEIQ